MLTFSGRVILLGATLVTILVFAGVKCSSEKKIFFPVSFSGVAPVLDGERIP